jgi:hypothetical protein
MRKGWFSGSQVNVQEKIKGKTVQFKIFLIPSARGCGKNLSFSFKKGRFQTAFGRFGHVFHKKFS